MPEPAQKIFREKALSRYLEERRQAVLPPLTGRGIFVWLWLTVVLLFAAGLVVYLRVEQILSHG